MNNLDRSLLKFAVRFHAALGKESRPPPPALPRDLWQCCGSLSRLLAIARGRGWRAAARRTSEHLQTRLACLRYELNQIPSPLAECGLEVSLREIYTDLLALQAEFPDVWCDLRNRTLTVETEPITLQEVDLGPFEIELDLKALAADQRHAYRVIAKEPQAAARDESITHPHVQDERLCEGEGRTAIQSALQQGRLLDFFLLVARTLETYNSSSPYVTLDEWYGHRCADCDNVVDADELCGCEICERSVCDYCRQDCRPCGQTACDDCIQACAFCRDPVCETCLKHCADCRQPACCDCLPRNHRCKTCHEKQIPNKPPEPAAAAVFAPGLVEAALPA